MRKLKPALALTLLFLLASRGGFPQEGIAFNAPAEADIQQNLRVGEPFAYSLCLGRAVVIPKPGDSTALNPAQSPCGSELNPSGRVTGGNGPYHFELETMGGFPPIGLVVDANGVLRGTPKGTAASSFRVCAVDLSGARSCETLTLQPQPAVAPNPTARSGGAGRAVAVVGGLALAAGGIAVAASALQVAEEGSTGASGGMTYVDSQGIVCFYNAGGVLSSCSGQIVVNITNKIAVGSTLRLFGSFWGGNRATTTSPPGSINFLLTGGTGGTSCPGPLTSLALLNLSESSSTVIASVGGISIPVTCR